jgi:hypothetical protein
MWYRVNLAPVIGSEIQIDASTQPDWLQARPNDLVVPDLSGNPVCGHHPP